MNYWNWTRPIHESMGSMHVQLRWASTVQHEWINSNDFEKFWNIDKNYRPKQFDVWFSVYGNSSFNQFDIVLIAAFERKLIDWLNNVSDGSSKEYLPDNWRGSILGGEYQLITVRRHHSGRRSSLEHRHQWRHQDSLRLIHNSYLLAVGWLFRWRGSGVVRGRGGVQAHRAAVWRGGTL